MQIKLNEGDLLNILNPLINSRKCMEISCIILNGRIFLFKRSKTKI